METEGCLDGVELLASLANKSMLVVEPQPELGMRYRLLETVRQYAREKLDDLGEGLRLRDLHADYYLDLAKLVGQNTFSRNAPTLLRQLKHDFPNVRAAFIWTLEGTRCRKRDRVPAELMVLLADLWKCRRGPWSIGKCPEQNRSSTAFTRARRAPEQPGNVI